MQSDPQASCRMKIHLSRTLRPTTLRQPHPSTGKAQTMAISKPARLWGRRICAIRTWQASLERKDLCWDAGVWVELEGNGIASSAGRKRFQWMRVLEATRRGRPFDPEKPPESEVLSDWTKVHHTDPSLKLALFWRVCSL
jgi:hypothetical protein